MTGPQIPIGAPQIPIGAPVVGGRGEQLGRVAAVFADNATGRLAWAAVRDREHTAVVPLERSQFDGATLRIPFGAEALRTAPVHDPAALISYEQGDQLARHYGLLPTGPPGTTAPDTTAPDTAVAGTSDPGTKPAGTVQGPPGDEPGVVTMTRSQEQLRAGTVNVVVGRARLVTFIVTEQQTFTIPVRRQEVRLVYDAVPEGEQVIAAAGPAEDVHEVVLHAEQVHFSTQVVPVERVRVVRRVVTTEQTVTAQLRAERIEHQQIEHEQTRHTSGGHADPDRHHDHQEM